MSSNNNWLSFSLSPYELQSLNPYQDHSSPTTITANCFSYSTDSASDVPLDINFSNPHLHQDWRKESSSELSMLVNGTNSCITTNQTNSNQNDHPKLEDFLNGHSYFDNISDSYSSLQLQQTAMATLNNPSIEESQSSSSLPVMAAGVLCRYDENLAMVQNSKNMKNVDDKCDTNETGNKRTVQSFGQRTSIYRGVTRHRWTGRYEAHLWDNSCKREGQSRKGRQVYLGGYDKEEKAARSYDLAAIKYWGPSTTTNFPISNYEKEMEEMKHMTRLEYIASLRRKSSGFSRGASIYRGVTRHHQHGRWQARIGRVAGNKDLYLGTFTTQEEAAEAYDIAAIKFRGLNAITNFEMNRYDVKSILESAKLPINPSTKASTNSSMLPTIAFQQTRPLSIQYPYYNAMPTHGLHDLNIYPSCSTSLELGMCTNFSVDINQGKQMEVENMLGWSDLYRTAYYSQSTDMHSALMVPSAPVFTVWDES